MSTLTTLPLWQATIVIVVLPTLLAMAGPIIVRRFVQLGRLNVNEIAGFKFATIGVVYAVMLAFAVVVVWERFNEADVGVAKEASAAATVFRLTDGFNAERAATVRGLLSTYLKTVIDKDWPAMAHGKGSADVTRVLDEVYTTLLKTRSNEAGDLLLTAEVLRQFDEISSLRRKRLVVATGTVPNVIWVVLFLGAVITISFTYFFGSINLPAQVLMTGALAVLILSGLLTVVAIDRPFAGTVKVEPEALTTVLDDFSNGR